MLERLRRQGAEFEQLDIEYDALRGYLEMYLDSQYRKPTGRLSAWLTKIPYRWETTLRGENGTAIRLYAPSGVGEFEEERYHERGSIGPRALLRHLPIHVDLTVRGHKASIILPTRETLRDQVRAGVRRNSYVNELVETIRELRQLEVGISVQ